MDVLADLDFLTWGELVECIVACDPLVLRPGQCE